MVSTFDLGWLVGILEGEGCFGLRNSPSIRLKMTDYDTVFSAALIMGVSPSKIRKVDDSKEYNRKTQYEFTVYGKDAIGWMRMVRPYMKGRRSAKIDEIVSAVLKTRPFIEVNDVCKRGHSIKHHWEYYLQFQGTKVCKRCSGKKVFPHIKCNDNSDHMFINPFEGNGATNV